MNASECCQHDLHERVHELRCGVAQRRRCEFVCSPCLVGFYAAQCGRVKCDACEWGTRASSPGASMCVVCAGQTASVLSELNACMKIM